MFLQLDNINLHFSLVWLHCCEMREKEGGGGINCREMEMKFPHEKCMTNANAPIANCKAAGSALLWPDLFYCSFANNFDVAKQDKGKQTEWLAGLPLEKYTGGEGWEYIRSSCSAGRWDDTWGVRWDDFCNLMISGLTWSSEAVGEVVRSIWRETWCLMLRRASKTSRPGRDLTCSIRRRPSDWLRDWLSGGG